MSEDKNIPIKQLEKLERQTKIYNSTTLEFKLCISLEDFILGKWNNKTVKKVKVL